MLIEENTDIVDVNDTEQNKVKLVDKLIASIEYEFDKVIEVLRFEDTTINSGNDNFDYDAEFDVEIDIMYEDKWVGNFKVNFKK